MKTLVLFVFHEIQSRVKNFFDNCIFEDDNVDFIVISNNKSNEFELPSYVKILKRDNIGFDFGGWSDALLMDDLYKNYDYFIFVNSSVIGPFLLSEYEKWTDIYINGLQQNNIKLFGSTINTCGDPINRSHVQSYIFSMNKSTLLLLIEKEIFTINEYMKTIWDTIENKEVMMSRIVIGNGGNIGSLLKFQKNIDYTFSNKNTQYNNMIFYHDPMIDYNYNVLWNEYDLVFIKGNRIPISYENVRRYTSLIESAPV